MNKSKLVIEIDDMITVNDLICNSGQTKTSARRIIKETKKYLVMKYGYDLYDNPKCTAVPARYIFERFGLATISIKRKEEMMR